MKRALFLLVLVVIFATMSAETYPIISAGFGSTWVAGNNLNESGNENGFMVGSSMGVEHGTSYLMEYGARYRTAGTTLSVYESDGVYTYNVNGTLDLSYLDIFAKAKLNIPFSDNIYLQPNIGYAMGFLLTAEEEWIINISNYLGQSQSGTISRAVKKEYSALNHTLLLGADLHIANRVILGIEFNIGLSNILDDDYKEDVNYYSFLKTITEGNMTTSAFMFRVGVSF